MRFTLDASEWKDVLKAASSYNDEAVINLKERGLLMRVQDGSNTGLYNTLIPKELMHEYNRGEHPRVGIYVEQLKNLTPSTDDPITVALDDYKIKATVGSRTYTTGNIDPDQVSSEPESVPNLDMPCKAKLDPDLIMSFIKDASNHIHSSSAGHFFISARKDGLHLWSRKDDNQIHDSWSWSDFEAHTLEWDSAGAIAEMPGDPIEEERMTSILSIPLTKDMVFFSDLVRLEMGHGMPLKMVSESEEGIKHSWIVPPRYPKDTEQSEIPESIINS